LRHDPSPKPFDPLAVRRSALGENGVLRLTTCGAVDDGKSTLLGRLLADAGAIYDDILAALPPVNCDGIQDGNEVDYALLFDGLDSEREQGITIDVAYRYFTTSNRKYVVADAPGHESHTRNMATAASQADLAIVLIDAVKGPTAQTFRHIKITSLVGVRHVILAVNKMDRAGFRQAHFEMIAEPLQAHCQALGFASARTIPVAAKSGENIVHNTRKMPWWRGPTLFSMLEETDVTTDLESAPFRMPVQLVSRLPCGTRGYAGQIATGRIATGDAVLIPMWGQTTTIQRIISMDGDQNSARAGDSITLILNDEFDISRGDWLCSAAPAPVMSDRLTAQLISFAGQGVCVGQSYLLKSGSKTVGATLTSIIETSYSSGFVGDDLGPREIPMNEIALCEIECTQTLTVEPFKLNRATGGFILIDRATADTVAAGMIESAHKHTRMVRPQITTLDQVARSSIKGHNPAIIWFTGLSGSGKSTIANLVEQRLHALGAHTYALDGDTLRLGLMRDLGFSPAHRVENIRRAGEVAKLFVDAGLIVTCAFISPYAAERNAVRALVRPEEFFELFVDTQLDVCLARDPKGLYKRALAGEISDFTGISAPYEPPHAPDIVLDTLIYTAEELADQVIRAIQRHRIIPNS
jgi:bifunctional enzyme CysN/CysC